MFYKIFKRFFDVVSSLLLFIIISPLFLTLIILVRIKIGSPVFFKQKRTGLKMQSFELMKFRTMTNEKNKDGNFLPDNERMTKVGRILRATSLDELPELLSIIKGDMSVIGPRPLPSEYDAYYSERERRRFNVRGGLIPPEVLFDNIQPTWDEQLEYEASYADMVSLKTDMSIIMTVFKGIFKRYKNNYGEYVRKGLIEERQKHE